MASTQLGTLFFIKHAHSQYLRANSYILVSWLLVLNGMPDLIKTNLFFFSFLYSDSICLYTSWKHSFLWDNNTKCLVKLKWMLIKLYVLTLHRGKNIFCVVKVIPFFTSHSFFPFKKLIYFLFAIANEN